MIHIYWPWFLVIIFGSGILGLLLAAVCGANKIDDLTRRAKHLQELNYQCCMREIKLKGELSDMRSKLILAKVQAIEDDG